MTVLVVERICAVAVVAANAVDEQPDWSQLTLFTTFPEATNWKQVQAAVGGIHRLTLGDAREEPEVPNIYIFLHCSQLNEQRRLEVSAWKGVRVACMNKASKKLIMKRLLLKHHLVIWFDSRHVFDPEALRIKRAELLGDSAEIKSAFSAGKQVICELIQLLRKYNHIRFKDALEGRTRIPATKPFNMQSYLGLVRAELATSALACHVVLKKKSILNAATLAFPSTFCNHTAPSSKRLVAIGVPTTSKGMAKGEEPVFMSALLSSMLKTLLLQERENFQIVVFIGFDEGDPYFDDVDRLKQIHARFLHRAPEIGLVFLRLLPLRRVAMTWNMIFAFARQLAPFEFFYQVNDDLTMITPGWLSYFTSTLDKNDGFGVVGPSDHFHDFACSLLTQAMVTERHFQLFSGLLYPLPFRDWKSDRWLSFVYGSAHTHCSTGIAANNGAKGTRYTACPFESWRVLLDSSSVRRAKMP